MLEMSGDVDILGDVTLALRAVRRPSPRWSSVYSLGLYDVRHPMADFRRHRPAPYHSPPFPPQHDALATCLRRGVVTCAAPLAAPLLAAPATIGYKTFLHSRRTFLRWSYSTEGEVR